ncbi:hypothetical protein Glove_13g26 [Diversispora epigaea]|uniref:Uncharacterized protein n=1 Tax=Diversispora epigaea TaxID=1348612 RepID=A0A397JNV7_9GLOM|nr:hypothetical protein Glove_13g26 [Diversispora epigaea]
MNDENRYSPRDGMYLIPSDVEVTIIKNNHKFTVSIKIPSKSFDTWTFPKACQLYELGEDLRPYHIFLCGCVDLKNENFKTVEAMKSIYYPDIDLVGVKRDNFRKGFAQATIRMESFLTCYNRKSNEIDDDCMGKV